MKTKLLNMLGAVMITGYLCAPATAQLVFDGAVMDATGRTERAGVSAIRMSSGAGVGELSIIDPRGGSRSRPLSETIALVPRDWAEPSLGLGSDHDAWSLVGSPFIELVDGQRFVGRPGRIGAVGETIAWVHERFGTISLPIDEVARFVMRPGALAAATKPGDLARNDRVWLANGDVLTGFLESVGPRAGGEGFALTIDTGSGNRVNVPVDQVVHADFANPRRATTGPVAWLADGSVVGLSAITTDTDRAQLLLTASAADGTGRAPGSPTPPSPSDSPAATPTAHFTPLDVNAICFDTSRVTALATIPIAVHRPMGLPRRPGPRIDAIDAIPTPLGAADILLPGPMEVEWTLPTDASRLIGSARLDEADWAWGECVVVVELVSGTGPARELARIKLDGASMAAPLAAELGTTRTGDRLRIRVEPGELGPIRDHVRLERVLLLRDVKPTAQLNEVLTIVGLAGNAKNGAVIETADGEAYYIDGLPNWPAGLFGKQVRVRGMLVKNDPQAPHGGHAGGITNEYLSLHNAKWEAVR